MILAADFIANFHRTWSPVVLIYAVLMALWGLFLFFRKIEPTGSYLGALVIAEGVVIVQGLLGIVLLIQGHRPADKLHYLYGLVALLALPAGYLYTKNGTVKGASLILGLASIFLVGVAVRAITTGG
ncbi:MAG: hypothetical protein ACR2JC_03935 [Chloroflexota bacterium]|nr:MAG: hypothetical protein DLM70_07320 [Chloroflexota bacterium]